jgi:hypothetical protein
VSAQQQVPEGVDPATGEVVEPAEPGVEPEQEPDIPFEEPAPEEAEPTDEPAEDEPGAQALSDEEIAKLEKQQQAEVEKLLDKLDREAKRHRDRLAEILQEDTLNLVPCELCRADLAGFIDVTQPMPEEVRQRVRIQIGDREPRKLRQDPHTTRCETCDGETVVETGAKDGPNITLACVDCGGKGWIATDEKRSGFRPAVPATPLPDPQSDAGNGGPVSHPALSPEDQDEIKRLQAKGIVVIVPQPA